ncbi:MAG: UPF0175 family protein [Chloroflexota bacterium]
MQTFTISVPDELAVQLEPYRDHLDSILKAGLRELRMAQGLVLYKQGNISVWKAARLADVGLREMTQYLAIHGLRPEVDDEMIETEIGLPSKGVSGKQFIHLAGTIPQDDLDIMQKVIDDGCGQFNIDK